MFRVTFIKIAPKIILCPEPLQRPTYFYNRELIAMRILMTINAHVSGRNENDKGRKNVQRRDKWRCSRQGDTTRDAVVMIENMRSVAGLVSCISLKKVAKMRNNSLR